MPHVELSLSDDPEPDSPERRRPPGGPWEEPPRSRSESLSRWTGAVTEATEPCAVLDSDGVIVASSRACAALLGAPGGPDGWLGRGLLDVLELVDLTAAGEPLAAWEAERIPPLLALSSGALARAVMRIRVGSLTRTLDLVSTPLRDGTAVVGSLTFLHRI
ncbi:MAG: hypothetical protein ACRDT6_23850 [Micromonosporaceae bacterium]